MPDHLREMSRPVRDSSEPLEPLDDTQNVETCNFSSEISFASDAIVGAKNEFSDDTSTANTATSSVGASFAGTPPKRSNDRINERVQQANQIRLDNRAILLADDSPDNQRLFQRILLSAGASVDLADNGAMAVKMQLEKVYDVIVMDIRMPILDGYQATRQIRTAGFEGPIIALTAHATPGEEGRCRDSGCSHFHLKPIDRLSLLNAVSEALDLDPQSSTSDQ